MVVIKEVFREKISPGCVIRHRGEVEALLILAADDNTRNGEIAGRAAERRFSQRDQDAVLVGEIGAGGLNGQGQHRAGILEGLVQRYGPRARRHDLALSEIPQDITPTHIRGDALIDVSVQGCADVGVREVIQRGHIAELPQGDVSVGPGDRNDEPGAIPTEANGAVRQSVIGREIVKGRIGETDVVRIVNLHFHIISGGVL